MSFSRSCVAFKKLATLPRGCTRSLENEIVPAVVLRDDSGCIGWRHVEEATLLPLADPQLPASKPLHVSWSSSVAKRSPWLCSASLGRNTKEDPVLVPRTSCNNCNDISDAEHHRIMQPSQHAKSRAVPLAHMPPALVSSWAQRLSNASPCLSVRWGVDSFCRCSLKTT